MSLPARSRFGKRQVQFEGKFKISFWAIYMILKNCHIYDESAGKEKTVEIYFEDTIIEYRENLSTEFKTNGDFSEYRLSGLTKENIKSINENSSSCIIDAEGMITIPGGIDPHVCCCRRNYNRNRYAVHFYSSCYKRRKLRHKNGCNSEYVMR